MKQEDETSIFKWICSVTFFHYFLSSQTSDQPSFVLSFYVVHSQFTFTSKTPKYYKKKNSFTLPLRANAWNETFVPAYEWQTPRKRHQNKRKKKYTKLKPFQIKNFAFPAEASRWRSQEICPTCPILPGRKYQNTNQGPVTGQLFWMYAELYISLPVECCWDGRKPFVYFEYTHTHTYKKQHPIARSPRWNVKRKTHFSMV